MRPPHRPNHYAPLDALFEMSRSQLHTKLCIHNCADSGCPPASDG
jgi:hypothetical protein